MTKTYRLPPAFYWDHVSRELPAGRVVKELARSVVVELDEEAFDDLLSDAEFYADSRNGIEGVEYLGLRASAKATAKTLRADPFSDATPREKRHWKMHRPQHEIDAGMYPHTSTYDAYTEDEARWKLLRDLGPHLVPDPSAWRAEEVAR